MLKRLFAILIISSVILSGCDKKDASVPTLVEPVGGKMDTAIVTRGDIYNLTMYDAKVYPDIQEVCSSVDGNVGEFFVYLGQEVKTGDLLLSLDDSKMKEQLTQLEKQLEDTKINKAYNDKQQDLDIQILELSIKQKANENAPEIEIAEMKADLDKLELVRQQKLDMNKYYIEKAQEKIDVLKKELEKTKVTAPCSGSVVYIKDLHIKGRINADETVIMIADESKLHIQSTLIDASIIKNASQIYTLINGNEYEIEYIPFEADELLMMKNSGVVLDSKFRMKEGNNDIASGDYACICVKEKLKRDVITIPKNSLYSDSSGKFVYSLIDGVLERSNVEIGEETDIQVEIISGLSEGDVVYVQK